MNKTLITDEDQYKNYLDILRKNYYICDHEIPQEYPCLMIENIEYLTYGEDQVSLEFVYLSDFATDKHPDSLFTQHLQKEAMRLCPDYTFNHKSDEYEYLYAIIASLEGVSKACDGWYEMTKGLLKSIKETTSGMLLSAILNTGKKLGLLSELDYTALSAISHTLGNENDKNDKKTER
jgi:hypothetical protein